MAQQEKPGTITGQVRNFRGVAKADIAVNGIALIAGQNGMGKSSMLQAVAAALACAPVPFFRSEKPDSPLLTKKGAGVMMHDGADMGGVRLMTEDGSTQISWPALDVKQQGDPPAASKVAAGLVTPIEMPDAQRALFFSQLLRTTPDSAELTQALTDPKQAGFDPVEDKDSVDAVIDRVEQGGFDGAHKFFSEFNAKNKGKWEQVTGQRYGNTKGNFKPEGWNDDLESATEESLAEAVAQAKEEVGKFTGQAAVDEATIEAAKIAAKKEPAAKMVLDKAKEAHDTAAQAHKAAQDLVSGAVVPKSIACPHCGAISLAKVSGGDVTLEKSELSAKEIRALEEERQGAIIIQQEEQKRLDKARAALDEALASHAQFKGAQDRLKKLQADAGEADNKDALLAAQKALADAEAALAALKTKTQADKLHARTLVTQKVLDLLSPDGLRKTKLMAALGEFNELLAGLCDGAGFPLVALNDELDIVFDGRPAFMCSDSQKYRARVIVQLAVAIKERACMVIIDGADILDADSRDGFFKLLRELSKADCASGSPINVLVAMTLNDFQKCPPLEKMGWGVTAWIEGGVITGTK